MTKALGAKVQHLDDTAVRVAWSVFDDRSIGLLYTRNLGKHPSTSQHPTIKDVRGLGCPSIYVGFQWKSVGIICTHKYDIILQNVGGFLSFWGALFRCTYSVLAIHPIRLELHIDISWAVCPQASH